MIRLSRVLLVVVILIEMYAPIPGMVQAECGTYRYYFPIIIGKAKAMEISALENIERLVQTKADFPFDGWIAEIQPETVSVKLVGSDQVRHSVARPDHIPLASLKKGQPVRLGQFQGQPILLAILPQLAADINYAGKGSIIPDPPQLTVRAIEAGWLIQWTAVPGAEKYHLYRNDTPDETSPDDRGYVTGLSVVVPYEAPFVYFAARSVSGLNESELSAWVTDNTPPPVPDTFLATNDVLGHSLTVSGTDVALTDPGFKCFEIEQAIDASGTGAVSLGTFLLSDFPNLRTFGVGAVRYYRIRSIDWAGNASGWTSWDFAYAGQGEIQDKFDGYGGSVTSPLSSLWWLAVSDFDTDETWTSAPGTRSDETSIHKEGNRAIKVNCVWDGQVGEYHALIKRTVSLNLSADGRFTNDDYVVIPIYVSTVNANIHLFVMFGSPTTGQSNTFDFELTSLVAVGWNYIAVKKSTAVVNGSPSWANITYLQVDYYTGPGGSTGDYYIVDDLRIVKADPDDAAMFNDVGSAWDYSADTGTDFGKWHVYSGNRSGEPAKPFSLGQIKTAASPAVWYLSHKSLTTTNIFSGTIQAGVYVKGADGQAGLSFFIKDVTAGSWDMYALEADSGANVVRLVKWVNGTRTVISTANFTFNPDQALWLGADFRDYDADGGRIKVYASLSEGNLIQASKLIISVQDTQWLGDAGGSVGLLSYQANVRFVSFVAGSPAHADVADVARSLDGPILGGPDGNVVLAVDQAGALIAHLTQPLKGKSSNFPDLGTTTLAEKFGNIYLGPAKDVFPYHDIYGLWSRFVNFAANPIEHWRQGSDEVTWTGFASYAGFVTPNTVARTLSSLYLMHSAAAARAFYYRPYINSQAMIFVRAAMNYSGEAGLMLDDGVGNADGLGANNFVRWFIQQATGAAPSIAYEYRIGGGAVTKGSLFTLYSADFYSIAILYGAGTRWSSWQANVYTTTEFGSGYVTSTPVFSWTPARHGLYYRAISAGSCEAKYDWWHEV